MSKREHLARIAEDHLLVRDEAAHPDGMHAHTIDVGATCPVEGMTRRVGDGPQSSRTTCRGNALRSVPRRP